MIFFLQEEMFASVISLLIDSIDLIDFIKRLSYDSSKPSTQKRLIQIIVTEFSLETGVFA